MAKEEGKQTRQLKKQLAMQFIFSFSPLWQDFTTFSLPLVGRTLQSSPPPACWEGRRGGFHHLGNIFAHIYPSDIEPTHVIDVFCARVVGRYAKLDFFKPLRHQI